MHPDFSSHTCASERDSLTQSPDFVFSDSNTSPEVSALFTKLFMFQAMQGKTFVRTLRSVTLHPGQMILCQSIEKSPGLSQRELADRIGIKPATVAIMLQKMENSGLISRMNDSLDRRISRIYITQQGKDANIAATSLLGSYLTETLGRLTKEQIDTFSQILTDLLSLNEEYQRTHFREEQTDETSSEIL